MLKYLKSQFKVIIISFWCGIGVGWLWVSEPENNELKESPYSIGILHRKESDDMIRYYYIVKDDKPLPNTESGGYVLFPEAKYDDMLKELNFYEKQGLYKKTKG